ncbi:amidase [Sphingomonas glaciei]|uniref:Amidase n=1 Tax=Sphingomonas glaciei TaxID=2938948 RepID=A0ABY5MUU1_9SPHN|nr:amidase [Sphingomonas glaciei]UUR07189.1 amidase [Sphingomonas glaciei]
MTSSRSLSLLAALALGGCAVASPEMVARASQGPMPLPLPTSPAAEAIARINARDAQLHAVIAVNPRAEAEGLARIGAAARDGEWLHGVPILIKDNVEVAGLPTTAGSLALAGNDTGRDAPIVTRLRRAGAIIVGKTNLSEWANIRSNSSISGWSAVGGQTRNPYALDRNTCGSSSGSGAAVAAGYTDYAIGSETDGSITCPASMTGVVGLKPTMGLVSRTHIVPISESQDIAGPMTRTVAQAATLLQVIAGSDPADPATAEADRHKPARPEPLSVDGLKGKRIAVLRFAAGFGTDAVFDQVLAQLRQAGAELVEIKSFKPTGNYGNAEYQVLLTELKAGMASYLGSSPAAGPKSLADLIAFNKANAVTEMALFGQDTFEEAEKTKGLADPAYRKARADSQRIASADLDRLLKGVDAVVFPTRPAAWKIDAVHGDVSPGGNGVGSMAAVAGYPHLTVPMGLVRGLPVGLSFIGPKWSDWRLLGYGHAFEQVRGAFPRPTFLPSIEASPQVAPALEPQRR